jgi:hypothetical protein
MESQFIFPFVLRFLPTLLLIALAFVAASDKKTGRQWANLLYQMGSIRPDQRDDAKIQSGVKLPFFVLAFAMLFLPSHLGPVSYYRWVTNKNEPVLNLNQGQGLKDTDDALIKMQKEKEAEPTPTAGPKNPPPPGGANPPPPSAPGAPSGGAPHGNTSTTPGSIGALR